VIPLIPAPNPSVTTRISLTGSRTGRASGISASRSTAANSSDE
jgi:hypothetical protein